MIVVIVITAVIGGMVAVFIQRPVQGYFDAARRAELTDIADTGLRRIVRDLRLALPNSVRVDPTGRYLEFLLTSGGGRYRIAKTNTGTGDILDFSAADSSFDVIGPQLTFAGGESIVVYNLGYGSSDAYAAVNNRAVYGGANGTPVSNVVLSAAKLFPLESPGNRFQVVQYPVTYGCDPTAGVNEIRRYWGYAFNPAQVAPPAGGSSARLAGNVAACSFSYDPNSIQGRDGVVSLSIQLSSDSSVFVNLFQEAHVSNVP